MCDSVRKGSGGNTGQGHDCELTVIADGSRSARWGALILDDVGSVHIYTRKNGYDVMLDQGSGVNQKAGEDYHCSCYACDERQMSRHVPV